MKDLLRKIKTSYVNDDGEQWTAIEEMLAEEIERLQAEKAKLRAALVEIEGITVGTPDVETSETICCIAREVLYK